MLEILHSLNMDLAFCFLKLNSIIKPKALALMEMESLDGINLFFLVLAERPKEAPANAIEKKVYDGELVMDSRRLLSNLKTAPEK